MRNPLAALLSLLAAVPISAATNTRQDDDSDGPVAVRVATFNIEDLRTDELIEPYSERAVRAAEVIQRIRPNIILINEIAYDMEGGPDFDAEAGPGQNAERLAALLAKPAAPGLEPLSFNAFTAESNTGRASGFDLDRNGEIVTIIPPATENQTDAQRAYGGDCWGFGAFPGQYGMALLVDTRLNIREEYVRTFRLFPWEQMPGAMLPETVAEEGENAGETIPWYEGEAGKLFRLSSKSHWDVPVELPNGEVLHVLASHPTPPAFDGEEGRNKKRNHDEIRFWADYVSGAAYIVDDRRQPGGLPAGSNFVIVGDLNADPETGSSLQNPVGTLLLGSRFLADDPAPTSDLKIGGLEDDNTARFGLRIDYVLPSKTVGVARTGIWRYPPAGGGAFPSDHFPVWADLIVPASP